MKNTVYIVGAGPGDPKLITIKAIECIKEADCILYDRLISKSLLKYRKPKCILKYVGKGKGKHAMKQDKINSALLRYAKLKKTVVRLKGGDPFIFGRGFEEALFLEQHGIKYRIVPGLSSFYSVPEICGIPLTHRGMASGFIVVTGHEDPAKGKNDIDWKHIAQFKGTIVILMGKSNLKQIVKTLTKNGLKNTTPCAVIHKGSTKQQKIICGNVGTITERSQQVSAPSIVVIGDVVKLSASSKPLSGKRYLVTSSAHLNKNIVKEFKPTGANVDCVPMIKITPNTKNDILREIISGIRHYDWFVFTSRHGVMYFLKKFFQLGKSKKDLEGKIACVGCGTADEFTKHGIVPSLVPERFTTKNLAQALTRKRIKGKRIALLRTRLEKDPLKNILRKAGAAITNCIVYNIEKTNNAKRLDEAIRKEPDGILFLSPKSADNFFDLVQGRTKNKLIKSSEFYSIGPVTTQILKQRGITKILEPQEHTVKGLVELCMQKTESRQQKTEDR